MAKNKYTFNHSLMGKLVVVTQVLERKYDGEKRFWEPVNVAERRLGWVVGTSFVCNGVYDDGQYDDPPCLNVTEKVPCLLVTYWPSQSPIKIPVDGFLIWDEVRVGNIEYAKMQPYCSSGFGSGVEREKQLAHFREFCKGGLDRDEKGRFK